MLQLLQCLSWQSQWKTEHRLRAVPQLPPSQLLSCRLFATSTSYDISTVCWCQGQGLTPLKNMFIQRAEQSNVPSFCQSLTAPALDKQWAELTTALQSIGE